MLGHSAGVQRKRATRQPSSAAMLAVSVAKHGKLPSCARLDCTAATLPHSCDGDTRVANRFRRTSALEVLPGLRGSTGATFPHMLATVASATPSGAGQPHIRRGPRVQRSAAVDEDVTSSNGGVAAISIPEVPGQRPRTGVEGEPRATFGSLIGGHVQSRLRSAVPQRESSSGGTYGPLLPTSPVGLSSTARGSACGNHQQTGKRRL